MAESRKTGHLLTEKINPRTADLDKCSPAEVIDLILNEDRTITDAIEKVRSNISAAVDLIVGKLRDGGRIFFIGAGTSGRLGVMEAAECPPTFGTDPGLIRAIIAGGKDAVWNSVEGAEDKGGDAVLALSESGLSAEDVLVGIAASATTPYVQGALEHAQKIGSGRILVTCNPVSEDSADVVISLIVGPEALVGSTRMKAGTATKMVLNMLTTASMVMLGKTYGNLMVDVQPRSSKLRDRAQRIVMHIGNVDEGTALELLEKSEWNVKSAVVMAVKGVSYEEARELLADNNGFLRKALG